jgi:RND family efflux transporter MFP subunit
MRLAEWTEVIGTTQPLPDRAAKITAPVEGRVVSTLQGGGKSVTEGQRISRGDVIVQMDVALIKAERDKAEVSLKELEQSVKQADLERQKADLDLKALTEADKGKDPKQSIIPPIQLATAKLALQTAEAKLKAAEFRVQGGAKELAVLDEQIKLRTLTAPIDGRLGRVLVMPGQTISAGTQVADVANLDDKIDVLCFVPPHVARKFQPGQPAYVGGFEGQGENQEGKVEFIAEQAEVDTGNFAVRIRFPNKDLSLRGSTTVRVRVLTMPEKTCKTLKLSAILEDTDPPMVVIVDDIKEDANKFSGKARRVRVTLGIRDRSHDPAKVEILELRDPETKELIPVENTWFVVERGQGLRTGDLVKQAPPED